MNWPSFQWLDLVGSAASQDRLPPWLAFFTFSSINVIYVLLGCMVLGSTAGVVGCFAFLRKRSLIGDALAHAALPGVCAAFMLTGSKNPLVMLAGATAACWAGAYSVEWIVRHTRCKEDSALGMVLSVFYGLGILMLTHIRKSGDAAQAGLDKYLLGQAASLVGKDFVVIAAVGSLLLVAIALAYKELKVISFDPEFAESAGMPRRALEIGLATLIVLAVAIGLQAVGVVLMAALLVTPAAAARYWTDRLGVMLLLAGVFGALSGATGAYVSYLSVQMPTGPWIVVSITTLFLVSLFFASKRGVAWRYVRYFRFRRKTAEENVLRTLYVLGEAEQSWGGGRSHGDILRFRNMSAGYLRHTLNRLRRKKLVRETENGLYALNDDGLKSAARITRVHRLWELYLTRKLELAPDHVHDDAEEIEHILTPDLEARLAAALDEPAVDPHSKPIPAPMEGGHA